MPKKKKWRQKYCVWSKREREKADGLYTIQAYSVNSLKSCYIGTYTEIALSGQCGEFF